MRSLFEFALVMSLNSYTLFLTLTYPDVRVAKVVDFEEKQSAITEGQFVAWYIGDELVGSGVIS